MGISAFLLCFIPMSARAMQIDEQAQAIYDGLDEGTRDILSSFGVDAAVDGDIFDVSFSRVFSALAGIFTTGLREPMRFTGRMLAVVAAAALFGELAGGFEKTVSLFCTFLCAASAMEGISGCVNALMSSVKICSGFLLAYVPVFALAVSLSGSPASALTYNSAVLTFSEIISRFSNTYMLPACGVLLSVGTAFSVNPVFRSGKLTQAVNRGIAKTAGAVMSVFTAVLGLKGIMNGAADGVASRGIRLVFSSLVPVIGSALSEAYSSIAGSLSLAKSSIAVFGIAAVFAVNLPVLLHSAAYGICLSLLSFASEAAGQKGMSSVFSLMRCTVRLMSVLVIMQIFLIVISTGIVLLTRGA